MKSTKAIVCTPNEQYPQGITDPKLRERHGKPDYHQALEQHKAYCDALRQAGITEIINLADYQEEFSRLPNWSDDALDHFSPDDCFVEDITVFTDHGVILTNPGHPQRRQEVNFMEYMLSFRLEFPIIGQIQDPGYLDGGDVVRAGNHYFLGYSDRKEDIRTNAAGLEQLEDILQKKGYSFSRIPVGAPLHLSTGSSYLGNQIIATIPEFTKYYQSKGLTTFVSEPDEEYAANMRCVNEYVLMPVGFPKMKKRVERLSHKVIELNMSEFQKQNGSMTCLSLLIPETFK